MRKLSCGAICCAALAAMLAFSALSFAAEEVPAQNDEGFTERQALREERASIKADHEALENEREHLKTKCLDARGQDKSACESEWSELRTKKAALEQRVKILHEKIRADSAHAPADAPVGKTKPPVAAPDTLPGGVATMPATPVLSTGH